MKKMFVLAAMAAVCFAAKAEVKILPYVGLGYYGEVEKFEGEEFTYGGFGFQVGAQAEIGLGEGGFTFNPGVAYTNYSTSSKTSVQGYDFTLTDAKNYIEIPLLFNYYFGEERSGFFWGVGPKLNLFLGGKWTAKVDVEKESEKIGKDVYNTFGVAVGANVGYQFPMGLRLAVVYDYNLLNMVKKSGATLNSSFVGAQVGWKF